MPPRLRFWVIADDLTGALDTAAPFAAGGWRTCVVPWPGPSPRTLAAAIGGASAGHDVVVVDTASRHVAAREAGRRVRAVVAAARRADADGPGRRAFFKKIDSTLRGNVAAEVAAFGAATATPCLPLAPAFPAQGRTTRAGAVWVGDLPLAASAAARDALDPAQSGDLARLAPAGTLDVLDARTDGDLRRIAARLARESRLGAVVGSGGLAAAIAARFGSAVRPDARKRAAGRVGSASGAASTSVLVVSGSAHPVAQAQARALVAAGALGLVVAVEARTSRPDREATEALARAALTAGRPVVLVCPTLAAGSRLSAARAGAAARRLAATARALVTTLPVGAVFTVGGDTTAALVAAMGWAPLAVTGALVPGVAVVRLRTARSGTPGPRWLITKSGAFGDASTLRRLVRRLTSAVGSRTPSTTP
jgi:D-threonate/D-erythronate kinase